MWVDLVKNQECLRRDFNPVLNFLPPPRRWFLPLNCVGADWFQDQAAVQHTERHRQDAAPLLPRKELRRRRRFPLFHFLQRPPRLWTWGHFTGGQTQGETAVCVCLRAQLPFARMCFFFIQWNSFIGLIQVGTAWLASLCGCFNDAGLPLCLTRRSCSLWIRSFMRTYTAIQQRATLKHASSLWRRTACGRVCCYCIEAAWRPSDGSSTSHCFLSILHQETKLCMFGAGVKKYVLARIHVL